MPDSEYIENNTVTNGPYFTGPTLDDVMRATIKEIQRRGGSNCATKGPNKELTGVLLEILQPRARLSRTETRGKPFSCLGELCWYLSGTNDVDFISYYISDYKRHAEDSKIYGGYGPRLFRHEGINQISNVISLLRGNPESRRAVVQVFDATDLSESHMDIPCTCSIQFLVRNRRLQMVTNMRSNDVILGLPHDVFSFTMLQELVARSLSLDIGVYKHFVGSLHLYDQHTDKAAEFLGEGFQPTDLSMPEMPTGDPWPAIATLLKAESDLRQTDRIDLDAVDSMDPYWRDLVRLLQVFNYSKQCNVNGIREIQSAMESRIYDTYILKKLHDCQDRLDTGE